MVRNKSTTLFINGNPLPIPDSGATITENDLDSDDTGRDEAGFMHRVRLRPAVKTWEFPYAHLSAEDYSYIRSLVSDAEFQVSFWGEETTAYCSNNSAVLRNEVTGDYEGFNLKIIEC